MTSISKVSVFRFYKNPSQYYTKCHNDVFTQNVIMTSQVKLHLSSIFLDLFKNLQFTTKAKDFEKKAINYNLSLHIQMRTSNYFLLEKVSWIFIWNWNLVWSQGNCGRHEFFNYGYHSRKPFSIKHAQELCAEKNATLSNFNTPEDIEKFYKRNKYLLERTCTEGKLYLVSIFSSIVLSTCDSFN